jgi:hypothetical protein
MMRYDDDTFTALDTRTGKQITLRMKRGDPDPDHDAWYRRQAAIAERQNREHVRRAEKREHFEKILGVDRDDGDGETVAKASGQHHLVARLTEHLLDVLERRRERHGFTKSATKEKSTMELSTILKSDADLISFCKMAVDGGNTDGVSEHELTAAVTQFATKRFPGEEPDKAFSKFYESSTAEALLVRKALRVCRDNAWGHGSAQFSR